MLHLFRDRLGLRPLYWTEIGSTFLFASAIKAFRTCTEFVPELDRDAVAAFLRSRAVPGPHTIYRGVHTLQPGSILSIDPGPEPQIRQYWALEDVVRSGSTNRFAGSDAEAADQVDALLRDAVARRTNGKPVGVFLSGGIDSSMLLAQLIRCCGADAIPAHTGPVFGLQAHVSKQGHQCDRTFDEENDAKIAHGSVRFMPR